MFFNYLATESFWNSALFMGGVWFGVLRAYTIFQFNRWLLLLITLTTLGLPFVFYLLVHVAGLSAFASFQTKYAALLGFAISTIFAEFTMMFFVPRAIRSRAQSRARQPLAAPSELPATPFETVITPPPAPPVRLKPIEPHPIQPVQPIQIQPLLEIKPAATPHVVQSKVRIDPPAPAPVLHSKPAAMHKPETVHKPEPLRKPVAPHKPEPIRNPEPVTRVAATTVEDTSDTSFHVGNWRLFVYFIIFMVIVLFPPYHETVTNNRTWLFITATNARPFFSFDLTFLLYEAVLLAAIVSVFEFLQAQD